MQRSPRIALSVLTALSATLFTDSACSQQDRPQPTSRKIEGSAHVTFGGTNTEKGKTAATIVHKEWNPKDARATCKVFHHVFAPDGTKLTKGLGGTFEHHRGLFTGWNKTKIDDKTFDFWHVTKGVSQRFRGHGTPSLLRMGKNAQVSRIDWCDPAGKVVVRESRGLEVVESHDDYYVMHVRSKCMTLNKDIELSGDPQHSGQQFRALQQFAEEGAKPVAYVRPAGAKGGANDVWTNCNWTAQVLELEKGNYTVLQVDGASNPGDTKWSTRSYGRFGVTRKCTITKAAPLILDQFYVVANGKRDAAWCAEQAAKLRLGAKKKAGPK